jgi:hypothetical protein
MNDSRLAKTLVIRKKVQYDLFKTLSMTGCRTDKRIIYRENFLEIVYQMSDEHLFFPAVLILRPEFVENTNAIVSARYSFLLLRAHKTQNRRSVKVIGSSLVISTAVKLQ